MGMTKPKGMSKASMSRPSWVRSAAVPSKVTCYDPPVYVLVLHLADAGQEHVSGDDTYNRVSSKTGEAVHAGTGRQRVRRCGCVTSTPHVPSTAPTGCSTPSMQVGAGPRLHANCVIGKALTGAHELLVGADTPR